LDLVAAAVEVGYQGVALRRDEGASLDDLLPIIEIVRSV
jgi:hypothetical protein